MNLPVYDFHCHSTCSDGSLSPKELVQRAKDYNVDYLSLTDHDTVAGIAEAQQEAEKHNINFIPGVEVSVSSKWGHLHIVGLDVDPKNEVLLAKLQSQLNGRIKRAQKIVEKLEAAGVENAASILDDDEIKTPGRLHFSKFLVKEGYAEDNREAFAKYLGERGKAYVSHHWLYLEETIETIHAAGGLAILAHPGRCEVGKNQMKDLLYDFKRLGGDGIEVSYGQCGESTVARYSALARKVGLLASVGSDFHNPEQRWNQLGCAIMPHVDLNAVWKARQWN